jgi:hypothetical protein
MLHFHPHLRLWGLLWAACVGAAQAAPVVIDSFDAPAAPRAVAKVGVKQMLLRDFGTSMAGGVRDAHYNVYKNPLQAVSSLAVGRGQLSVAAGTGALGEMLSLWGAYTRPNGDQEGGPLLGLDLSHQHRVELSFSGVEATLNLAVELYTHAPLHPESPVYYTLAGVNVAPASPGAPLVLTLDFNPADGFNYAQVDGIALLIDRSGSSRQNSYVLTQVRFLDD